MRGLLVELFQLSPNVLPYPNRTRPNNQRFPTGTPRTHLDEARDTTSSSNRRILRHIRTMKRPCNHNYQDVRRVSFVEEEPGTGSGPAPPLFAELTQEICEELWYQKEDYSEMKREVQSLLLHSRLVDDECLSGLGRFSPHRMQYKRVAMHFISAAVKRFAGEEKRIEAISKRCTAQPRRWAAIEGISMYCQVYGESSRTSKEDGDSKVSLLESCVVVKPNDPGRPPSSEPQDGPDRPPAKRRRVSCSEEVIQEVGITKTENPPTHVPLIV